MTDTAANNRRRGSGKGRRRRQTSRQPSPEAQTPLGAVQVAFYACGRCSYFLAGYRALHGLEHLVDASQDAGDQLTLRWDGRCRQLLHKSFGGAIDRAGYYYTISCPECHRAYSYLHEDGASDQLQVEILPRSRH